MIRFLARKKQTTQCREKKHEFVALSMEKYMEENLDLNHQFSKTKFKEYWGSFFFKKIGKLYLCNYFVLCCVLSLGHSFEMLIWDSKNPN